MFIPDSLYIWQTANSSSPQPILLINRSAYQCEGSPSDPPIIFRLPIATLKGFNCKIIGWNRQFRIIQNANQFCYQGNSKSTVGATGKVESTNPYDILQLQCMIANTVFCVHDTNGNINFT